MAQSATISEFNSSLVYVLDQLLPGTGGADLGPVDSRQTYLREVMHFNDAQVQDFRNKAEAFYLERYGLDFTQVTADSANIKNIPGAALVPFRINPLARFQAYFFSQNPPFHKGLNRDGGFVAFITGPGVTYHGTFGGAAGKPASQGDTMPFGFYNIAPVNQHGEVDEKAEPFIISYHPPSPIQPMADGSIAIHCQVQNAKWGIGVGRGIQLVTPANEKQIRVMQRSVVTFPAGVLP